MNKLINSYIKNDKDLSHCHTKLYVRYLFIDYSQILSLLQGR